MAGLAIPAGIRDVVRVTRPAAFDVTGLVRPVSTLAVAGVAAVASMTGPVSTPGVIGLAGSLRAYSVAGPVDVPAVRGFGRPGLSGPVRASRCGLDCVRVRGWS